MSRETVLRILAWFWSPTVNKEVSQFIRAFSHCQLVNLCSREAQKILHTIDSDTLFDMVFLYFWETGDIPYQDGYGKIIICLDCMTGFAIGEDSFFKEHYIRPVRTMFFWKKICYIWASKMIVVDADVFFQ